ncbi:uncharacterized protein LOC132200294 [Neocloeon triangulifer]|uniref:uncharacterized protein LOC132200294 n=1 Tax=Neocloeon triangulifer TaxID=2078957 RepID=UPI00286EDAB2|nr:uncharacterized protein LOC132200294 [Neocloeon triangulifer]
MDLSVRNFITILRNHSSGRSKYSANVFVPACESVEQHAFLNGLSDEEFLGVAKALAKCNPKKNNLPSNATQKIIRLLIPAGRPRVKDVEVLLVWLMSYWKDLPRNAAKTALMWFIGALQFELIRPEDVNWSYDVFCGVFEIKSLNLQLIKFLELMTTPNLVTRFRTQMLWNECSKSSNQKPVFQLLSFYKSIRPDKVPMQIPVFTSNFQGSTGEKTLMDQLERAAARADQPKDNPEGYNFAQIRWAMQRARRSKKQGQVLPTISYTANVAARTENVKELLECETLNDVAVNILTARTPAQVLSLATSPEAIFFLKFKDSGELTARFNYCLLRMFGSLENLYFNPQYKEDISQLLQCIATKQDIDLEGSIVVTNFIQNFLKYNRNPIFLPLVLKLLKWPRFEGPIDLYQNLLIHVESAFASATFRHKELIIESLWNLAINLLSELEDKLADDFEWSPKETLQMIFGVIEKFYDHCIASRGLTDTGGMIPSAITHYLELFGIEATLHHSFSLHTVAPRSVLLCSLIGGPSYLVEQCSKLIVLYKSMLPKLPRAAKKEMNKSAEMLDEVFLCFFDILFDVDKGTSLLTRVVKKNAIPVISKTILKKPQLLRYFGLLIERLLSEEEAGNDWTLEDFLEFCNNNFMSFAELLEFTRNAESQQTSNET